MASSAVAPLVRASGHGRQPASVEQLRDLQDELTALLAERSDLATEIEALSRRMEMAIMAGRDDVALHVAARLEDLAHSLIRRSAA